MLVLTRKKNESIIIGDVMVTIAQITPHQVRIAIEAPKNVTVHREEVVERIKKVKQHQEQDGST